MEAEEFYMAAHQSDQLARIAVALERVAAYLERQAHREDDLLHNEYEALKQQAAEMNERFRVADSSLARMHDTGPQFGYTKDEVERRKQYVRELEAENIDIHDRLAAFERKYPHLKDDQS